MNVLTRFLWCKSSYKKEWNNAIYSNMDGTRDYHTKWSKSKSKREISHDITYMCNLKKNDTNEVIYRQKQTHRLQKQTYGCQRGEAGKRGRLGVWNWHMHTIVYEMNSQQQTAV